MNSLANAALADAAGILIGYAADRRWADPQRYHPVAGFGQWAMACQQRLYRPTKGAGSIYLGATVAPWVAGAAIAQRGPFPARMATTAVLTWACLGGRSLEREANAVYEHLRADDLPAARARIASLVGRDTSNATSDDLARAVVESLAENQSDAVAATLVWAALAGPWGAVLHRCVNTLDAMVGYRSERFAQFGWASAKTDDVLNWLPARVSTVVTFAVAAVTEGPRGAKRVVETVRRDAGHHPSPNAGLVEAAAAAILEVRLGGVNSYGGQVQNRGFLGDGRAVSSADIPAAIALTRRVGRGVLGFSVVAALTRWR